MAWKDLQARIKGFFSGRGEHSTRRPDGGTSCYRPVQRRNAQEENLAKEKAAEYAASQPQIAYAHTGFTGMNPPTTGNNPVQGMYAGDAYGFGGIQTRQEYRPDLMNRNLQQDYQAGYVQQAAEQPASNISYMPGFGAEAGSSFPEYGRSLRGCT